MLTGLTASRWEGLGSIFTCSVWPSLTSKLTENTVCTHVRKKKRRRGEKRNREGGVRKMEGSRRREGGEEGSEKKRRGRVV